MKAMALFLVVFAPLPFWALGLPWCMTGDRRRLVLAPLVGCALAGLFAEWAMMAGVSPRGAVGALALAGAVFAFAFRGRVREDLRAAAVEWLPIYFLSVLASSISPFPIIGEWSGDWYLLYQMGEHVIRGDLPMDSLARPPLFGAATAPLWIFSPGLIPFQLMSAVAAASGVTATVYFTKYFWPKVPRYALLPLLLSPFFLHHTAAAWAKLLAAGLILAAIIEARRDRIWASGALFALSVAVHEGSIIWAPCLLVAHGLAVGGWRGTVRAVAIMAVTGLLIAGPLQAWILLKYGLAAKIASSPVVTDHKDVSFALKSLLAVVTTFIGWEPLTSVWRWMTNPLRFSTAVVVKESFWLVQSWFTTMAGTMLGLLFPFALFWRRLQDDRRLRELRRPPILAAVGMALLGNALLTGFYSSAGTMQAALVALALGVYGLLAGQLASAADSPRWFRLMSWSMAVLGTLPWVVTNLLTAVGLWLSQSFRARMQAGSEGDYFRVIDNHLSPLGMATFPEVPLLAAVLLAASLWLTRNDAQGGRKNVSTSV